MIKINEALKSAKKYISDVNKMFDDEISDVRLEEIETDNDNFKLTISYLVPNKNQLGTLTGGLLERPFERIYKTLIVNKEDGKVESAKIYKNV